MSTLPSLFLAHGAPDLPLTHHPAKRFLQDLPKLIDEPRAILVVSAHWSASPIALTGAAQPETVHDFAGWPNILSSLHYPARTDPALLARIQACLEAKGFESRVDPERGYDHGAWIPLMMSWPAATLPVIQLSLDHHGDAAHHFRLGQTLAPLRQEGILIIGSGATVHNLRALAPEGTPPPDWALHFDDWLQKALNRRDLDSLLQVPAIPVSARIAHPTLEHLMPLFLALGAGWRGGTSRRLHQSYSYGSLSMASYAFGI